MLVWRERAEGPVGALAVCHHRRCVAGVVAEFEADFDPFGGWDWGKVGGWGHAAVLLLLLL